MPTLRFHAVTPGSLLNVNQALLKELMDIYQVPADHINIEIINSQFIVDNELKQGFPIVEVVAFRRADEIQDAVAKCVSDKLIQAGYPESELYFTFPETRWYYGNGEHY